MKHYKITITTPLFPATGMATGSFNGLHPKSKLLAAMVAVAAVCDRRWFSGRPGFLPNTSPINRRYKRESSCHFRESDPTL